jgi:hypothetical protein
VNFELEELLASRWPDVFRGRDRPLTQSLMTFGCECGDGWYPLLDALCETLTEHASALGRLPPEAVQIKEKYATLRFYVGGGGDEYDDGAIGMAEDLSGRICEISGAPGFECVQGGWYATRTPEIAAREDWTIVSTILGRPMRPLPPVPTAEAASLLRAAWSEVVLCDPKVPPGFFDVVDVLASRLDDHLNRGKAAASRILVLGVADGELAVEVDAVRDRDLGAVAMSVAMSRRTDPKTGMCWMP